MDKSKFRVALLKSGGWEVVKVEDWAEELVDFDKYRFIVNTDANNPDEALQTAKREKAMVNTVSQRSRNKEKLNG